VKMRYTFSDSISRKARTTGNLTEPKVSRLGKSETEIYQNIDRIERGDVFFLVLEPVFCAIFDNLMHTLTFLLFTHHTDKRSAILLLTK